MDDLLNKTFRMFLDPATPEKLRENAHSQLLRMIGNKEAVLYLDADDEIGKLRREKAAMKLELIELREKELSWNRQLSRLLNALKHRQIAPLGDDGGEDREIHNRAKQWLVDKITEAGAKGISKRSLMAEVKGSKAKASITKRWSEVQNENFAFLINDTHGDQILVRSTHHKDYPSAWETHQKRIDARVNKGTTKTREVKEMVDG